jgi:hypothetical protein
MTPEQQAFLDETLGKSNGRKENHGRKRANGNGSNQEAAWLALCITDSRGAPISNLANAMVALRNDRAMRDFFAFDEMLPATVVVGETPQPVTDVDVTALQERLQLAGLQQVAKETVHQAIDLRAHERAFRRLAPASRGGPIKTLSTPTSCLSRKRAMRPMYGKRHMPSA